jgi:hypothetical protein
MTDPNTVETIEPLHISEEKDGSVIVDLPDSIPSPQHDDSDEGDEAAKRAEIAAHGSVDPEAEAMREAKRLKRRARKDYHKQVASEKDIRLEHLSRQNQELVERLANLERKSHHSDLGRLDKAIEDQETRILFAKQKMIEATDESNGELLTSAQEMWFEAQNQAKLLRNMKHNASVPQQRPQVNIPDPMLQRHAANWMESNDWYDPNGKDPDSKVALTIDQALAEEGWNPKSAEYWDELDNRLQKYLPHRYTNSTDERTTRRPRNVVTSSGRESASSSGGRNSFTLNPDQVRAMKDAGMWDDPDKRAKMIRRYATEARQHNSRG